MKNVISPTTITGGNLKFKQLINGTLTEVTEEDLQGNTKVNDYAFYNQKSLRKVQLPDTIIEIGSNAFYNCSMLEKITLSSTLTNVGANAFYNTIIGRIESNSITTLSNRAFANMPYLTELILPNLVNVPNSSNLQTGFIENSNRLVKLIVPNLTRFIDISQTAFTHLKYVDFTNLVEFYNRSIFIGSPLDGDAGILKFPNLISLICTYNGFIDNRFKILVFDKIREIYGNFSNNPNLKAVVIKSEAIPILGRADIFTNTPIRTSTDNGFIYVLEDLIDEYKSATNLSVFANKYRPYKDTIADLSSIDITIYTKAYVGENDSIYNYTDGEWVKES